MTNTDFWEGQGGKWYVESCKYLHYPQIPLAKYLEQVVRQDDTVLDVGCGFGFSSLYLSTLCSRVYALDPSKIAMDWLRGQCAEQGIENVVPVCASFPDAEMPVCDVSLTVYINQALFNLRNMRVLLDSTRREGLIMMCHSFPEGSIRYAAHKALGLPLEYGQCRNGCYAAGLMEALGAKCDCETVEHDFGQPVRDMEEAAAFLRYMLHVGEDMLPQLRKLAESITEQRGDVLFVPNMRRSCLVHFRK